MKVTKIDIDKSVAKGNLLANLTIVLDYDFELHNIQLLTGKKGEYMKNKPLTGQGVGVAVLDTGIFPHIDFDNRIRAFHDFLNNRKRPYDDNGHGTHVAGLIAGDRKSVV